MALLEIVQYPDKILHKVSSPVDTFNDRTEELVRSMFETMYAAPGVGLAANQVGLDQRIFVIDISNPKGPREPRVFINPEIVSQEGELTWEEGCLSLPEFVLETRRSAKLSVRAKDEKGREQWMEAEGLLAVAIQHEIDHINGVLLIDKVSGLKRSLYRDKLRKRKKGRDRVAPF